MIDRVRGADVQNGRILTATTDSLPWRAVGVDAFRADDRVLESERRAHPIIE
jgi:hypothetical protein